MRVYSCGQRACLKFVLRPFALVKGVTGTQDDNIGGTSTGVFALE